MDHVSRKSAVGDHVNAQIIKLRLSRQEIFFLHDLLEAELSHPAHEASGVAYGPFHEDLLNYLHGLTGTL